MAWYTCVVNSVGPATDGTETPAPVIYINLTDTGNPPAFSGYFFYAANTGQNQMLAVALAAISGSRQVAVGATPPNPNNNPFTEITRLYLNAS